MNPQVGIGLPFAPLRIGPDGLSFELCGTMLKVAPVTTKKLFIEISSFKKSNSAFVGKDIAVAALTLLSAELGRLGGHFTFPTGCKGEHICSPLHRSSFETCTSRWAGSENFGN